MKISLITVVYNGDAYLRDCIESVINQTYTDIEYIIIDGGSTDRTLSIIQQYAKHIGYFVSEKDEGLYDAINKGIKVATGAVIGILNADDLFADNGVIEKIANTFLINPSLDAVYGDLNYIHPKSRNIIRKWKSEQAGWKTILKGWMPAHPTLYIKRDCFDKYGNYVLNLGTAADYDLILRFFYVGKIKAAYLPFLMVNMRLGGLSNNSFKALLYAVKNDYKALRYNKVPFAWLVLFKKKFSKLGQFIK